MSLKIDTSEEFVDAIGFLIAKEQRSAQRTETNQPYIAPEPIFKLGRISSSYTSGRPQILFEGETLDSLKLYPYLASYVPVADDWVLLARVGSTYVVLGKII